MRAIGAAGYAVGMAAALGGTAYMGWNAGTQAKQAISDRTKAISTVGAISVTGALSGALAFGFASKMLGLRSPAMIGAMVGGGAFALAGIPALVAVSTK